jgi:Rad3-related DNA helicase
LRAFEYSLEADNRRPLNYTYAIFSSEEEVTGRVNHRLVVKAYYVAPLIKRLLGQQTVVYSATIGDPIVFGYETGIDFPFLTLPSDFPNENTRVFLPTDTFDLAQRVRRQRDLPRTLRQIARACRRFADEEVRSLVVVISEDERQRFLRMCREESVEAISYGDDISAKDAARIFKEGQGDALVGTAANYGRGVDLPRNTCPVIFFLRPGYPRPDAPESQFEEKRFRGSQRWAIWRWRVMIEALQVRGRNVRSTTDVGVTFFISRQFRDFAYGALPQWLRPAYRGDLAFEECIEEALEVIKT